MATINYASKEIYFKIVYYGCAMCGKTSNLQYIHSAVTEERKGNLVSLATESDRTLFFDFLPVDAIKLQDFITKFQLYTVPGQVQYRSTRKLVLMGVDAVVFVADSLAVRREKNMLSLKDLQENLRDYNLSIFQVPIVMQYNKRDLADQGLPTMSVEQMGKDLNRQLKAPEYAASALSGPGVGPTLKECLKLTLQSLQKQTKWAQ